MFLTLLPSCFPLPWLSSCLLLSLPGVSGGGKAQVFAKLMTCLCAKLTGGWTSTQTPLMVSQPLCWRPRSPVLALCRLQPLPTHTLVALAPQSMPELLRATLPRSLVHQEQIQGSALDVHHSLVSLSLHFQLSTLGPPVASFNWPGQGQPQDSWGKLFRVAHHV